MNFTLGKLRASKHGIIKMTEKSLALFHLIAWCWPRGIKGRPIVISLNGGNEVLTLQGYEEHNSLCNDNFLSPHSEADKWNFAIMSKIH